ncbi:MAG: hypothetical protein IKV25_07720 [Clostridia bacterium]|nr:hypothetical protein [Clostridia bacterium]
MKQNSYDKEIETMLHNLIWLKRDNNFSKEEIANLLEINVADWEQIEKSVLPKNLTVNVFYIILENFGIHPSDLIYKELWK